MKHFAFVTLLILIAISSTGYAQQLSAKTIESVTVEILQSGTLRVSGSVLTANLTYYIPQEGVKAVEVNADGDMTWGYTLDSFGNKLALLEWKKPTGSINYRIKLIIENKAKHTIGNRPVGTDDFYLKETNSIQIDDSIRQFAFPFEKSLKRAAELTKFVYDYVEYDLGYVGRNAASNEVLVERRGVCVEHANLLTALLRANEIPTRYAVGYAYSSVQEKFIGHTWVEVLTEGGEWVPFDPTWLQAGYIDATHIKSAVLLDNNQIDTLTYIGGNIDWTRNEDQINLLSHTVNEVTSISATGTEKVANDGYGYIVAATLANECTLVDMTANSCVNELGIKQLDIKEPDRSFWTCGQTDTYWFFRASGGNYICPVSIYDQTGGDAKFSVSVQGRSSLHQLSITGPDTVGVNERFTLRASESGLFYSPEFGLNAGTAWELSTKYPGSYKFYLYANDGLYVKTVNVVQKKEFEVSTAGPASVSLNSMFTVNATVRNLMDRSSVTIIGKYTNQTTRRQATMDKGQSINFTVGFKADRPGLDGLVVSASGNSFASDTIVINTPGNKSFMDGIFGAIAGFFAAIGNFFGNLFGK